MNGGKLLIGGALVAVGAVWFLQAIDVVDDAGAVIGAWWPLVLVGAAALAVLGRPRSLAVGGILGVVGIVVLLVTTDVLGGDVLVYLWPLALVAVGLWILFGRRIERQRGSGDETVDVTVLFSGREIASYADPFRGGSLTAVFGGLELDLRDAVIHDVATLDVVAVFGGAEITVPAGWQVRMNGPAIFGGYDSEATQPVPPDAPRLDIRVLAAFGGVDVKVKASARAPARRAVNV